MDPWQRAYFLPVARHGQTGEVSAAMPQSFLDLLQALKLPGDVYQGNVQRNVPMFEGRDAVGELAALQIENPDYIKRLSDLAGALTLGSGAIPAEKGALRAGASMRKAGSAVDDLIDMDAPVKKGIKAYHGSPHDFDEFSLSKIGTGEGAQAYGHGLYFAENEGVARSYRNALSNIDAPMVVWKRGDGSEIDILDVPGSVLRLKGEDLDISYEELLTRAEHGLAKTSAVRNPTLQKIEASKAQQALDWLRANDGANLSPRPERGRMYEVNIAADPGDFLDWDAPLSGQPAWEKIKKDWDNNLGDPDIITERLGLNESVSTGRQYLDAIAPQGAGDAFRGASSRMREQGIPGIKYLDAGSRGAGDGSRNYVVFDDKLISIVRKYGIAALVSAGVLSQADGEALAAQGYE